MLFQNALNAIGERHLAHGTTVACAMQLNGDNALFVNVDQLNVAAVGLKRRANKIEHAADLVFIDSHSKLLTSDVLVCAIVS